jgi:hypothetical protein
MTRNGTLKSKIIAKELCKEYIMKHIGIALMMQLNYISLWMEKNRDFTANCERL